MGQKMATSAGFEPARAEPNGLAVHRLNHSAMMSKNNNKISVELESNQRPPEVYNQLQSDALPLSYQRKVPKRIRTSDLIRVKDAS